ncbi:glycosyltransferase family 2 protein [Solitalea koreensis]|uniref:Glycosyltransferase, GT2 family n=1 Tax=Solitalea koreensis TaxID=543615 RepID=A0A521CRX9_9SPHI|nr:glycosyltransferase family 2 protein [Solitalea koreensis]SMO61511.1 Glycosyltransferase, GT2 family [Solitalea koreensis]
MVKYSIITVCLNSEETIERCIRSVQCQKGQNIEHIVIDGLSSDKTLDIVKKYEDVTYLSEKDNGIYDAMNKGVNLSKGDYVLFLNSDDELKCNYFEECDRVLENSDFDFLGVGVKMISNQNVREWIPENLSLLKHLWRMPIPHPGFLVKRNLFLKLGGFDTQFRIAADYDFVLRLFRLTNKGAVLKKSLVNFYLGGVSNSSKILAENHNVRIKNYNSQVFIYLAYALDYLRWIKNK